MGWEVGGAEGGWGTSFSPYIEVISFEFSSVVFRNTLFTGFSQLRTFSDRVCGCKYDHFTALPRE